MAVGAGLHPCVYRPRMILYQPSRMSVPVTTHLDHVCFSGASSSEAADARTFGTPRIPAHRAHAAGRPAFCARATPMPPLAGWLLSQIGINAHAYRPESLQRRVPACLRHLHKRHPSDAQSLLEQHPELIPGALDSVLIGVTDFFRDDDVFRCLREAVLPDLLRTRDVVRVLSAAVSSGEELYSVAMLLAQLGALDRCELLGLDCRPHAIERARQGEFSAEQVLQLDPELRRNFFRRAGVRWVVNDCIRSRIHWCVGDVFAFAEPGARDLILFRNLAIYLTPRYAAAAWTRLCSHLTPGAFLVAGRAEQPPDSLPLRRLTGPVYRRT